jgi:hypothetical protein
MVTGWVRIQSTDRVRTVDISWFICDKMLRLEAVNGLNGIDQCILDTKPIQPSDHLVGRY